MQLQDPAGRLSRLGVVEEAGEVADQGWVAVGGWVCLAECERGVRLGYQGGHGAAKESEIRVQEEERRRGMLFALSRVEGKARRPCI